MGSGSLPPGISFVSSAQFFSLLLRREAAPADGGRFPSPSAGATSAYASRAAPATAEEAVAFATESSLASTDAARSSPLNEIVRPFAPLPFASSAPCPFGLFFELISNQFVRCAEDALCLVGRSGKPCTSSPRSAPCSAFVCERQKRSPCARAR